MNGTKQLAVNGQSVFAPLIEDYVQQKRLLGNSWNAPVESLNLFDHFCVEKGISEAVMTEDILIAWSEKRELENATTHYLRVKHVQDFSAYLHRIGLTAPYVFHPLPKKESAALFTIL